MNQIKPIAPIIISVAIAAVLVILLQQQANASIPGDFGQGYDAGRANAYNTFFAGGHYNIQCHSSLAYCAGYGAGYGKEWRALQSAYAR